MIAITVGLLGTGLFLFWLINAHSPFWLAILFGVTYGLGVSGIMPLRLPLLVEYFGTRKIGAIFGITSVFSTLAGITAVPLIGLFFDKFQSYKPIWEFLVGGAVISVILMLLLPSTIRFGQAVRTRKQSERAG